MKTLISPSLLASVGMALLISALPLSVVRADLVQNGNFETVGVSGPNTNHSGIGGVGASAAADWSVFHQQSNPDATTETNLRTYDELGIGTIDPGQDGASDHVLRVETSHSNNGLVQVWSAPGTGPSAIAGGVWIWVNGPGQVGVGAGNGGATSFTGLTTLNNTWEFIPFHESTTPVNEMVIYSSGGSAEFYVDLASATSVPEPSIAGLGIIAGLGLFSRRRRRR